MKSYTIVKGEKVRLVKELKDLVMVGQIYEVANITNDFVVIRNKDTKIACASVIIDDFNNHFEKLSNDKAWTNWIPMVNTNGSVAFYYRTNYKRVQVKAINGLRSEATCSKEDDFNLELGIQIALERLSIKVIKCEMKCLEAEAVKLYKKINTLKGDLLDSEHRLKTLISKVKPSE